MTTDIKKIVAELDRLSTENKNQRKENAKVIAEIDRLSKENQRLHNDLTTLKQIKQSVNSLTTKVRSIESKLR